MNGRLVAIAAALIAASGACAQAQVVQLPTFHQFGVSTTVMVPDGGTMSLGRVYRARESEVAFGFGPLRNRAIGREAGTDSLGLSARIIDLHEMDEEVLRAASRDEPAVDRATVERAARVTRGIASSSGRGPLSVAELRRERAEAEAAQRQQVLELIARGDAFREQGKFTTAKVFYRLAWQRTTDEQLRGELKNRYAQLEQR